MKNLFKFIGGFVIAAGLLLLVLCRLSEMGFLTGALSEWAITVSYHFKEIWKATIALTKNATL